MASGGTDFSVGMSNPEARPALAEPSSTSTMAGSKRRMGGLLSSKRRDYVSTTQTKGKRVWIGRGASRLAEDPSSPARQVGTRRRVGLDAEHGAVAAEGHDHAAFHRPFVLPGFGPVAVADGLARPVQHDLDLR